MHNQTVLGLRVWLVACAWAPRKPVKTALCFQYLYKNFILLSSSIVLIIQLVEHILSSRCFQTEALPSFDLIRCVLFKFSIWLWYKSNWNGNCFVPLVENVWMFLPHLHYTHSFLFRAKYMQRAILPPTTDNTKS